MYQFQASSRFRTQFRKLADKDKEQTRVVIEKLLNNEALERKHKDHALKGEYQGYRECHIRADLILIYQKYTDILILVGIAVGSHSELFG